MIIKLPLKQHVGVTCQTIINEGDYVERGELIAIPDGLGANIHASVSGIIKEIHIEYVIIEADKEQTDTYIKIPDTDSYIEAVKKAGVVGAGGAGFPAHVKFNIDLKGGYVITNAAECEPVLSHNIKWMEENPEVLIRGLQYAMKMTNASKGYIAIKPKYKTAMVKIAKIVKGISDMEVKFLPDMYPAGDERVIVREILGVELEPGELPSKAKAVISNVETLKNVVMAIEERKPVISKDITIGGRVENVGKGKVFFDVPLGTSIGEYINACGGLMEYHGEIVIGGPFTGKAGTLETPVNKTTGGAIVAMPFPQEYRKVGIIACECGAQEERLKEIALAMGGTVVAEEKCKRMVEVNGRFRCDLPGVCPGQTEKVLSLKRQGAEVIITGTCED